MSKRSLTLRSMLSVILFVLMLLSVIGLAGCNKSPDPTTEPVNQTTEPSTAQPTETTMTPPGVDDSIFDDNTGAAQSTESAQTTQPPETTAPAESTKPTESKPDETTQPPVTTVPPETTLPPETTAPPTTEPPTTEPPTTEPPATEPPATEPTQGSVSPDSMTYEAYNALSAAEQKAFMNSFASIDKFFEWYNAAKKAYEEANPPIDVGDGNVNIGDIIGGNG